jgi:hypothetical protein
MGALAAFVIQASARPIVIDGVADRPTYTDGSTFRVQTNAGFTYLATLKCSGLWLESPSQITGPWTPLTATTSATINISGAQQFFRLRKPLCSRAGPF